MPTYTMSVDDVMQRLGYTATYVYMLIRSHRLDAIKAGKRWMLNRDSVERLKRERVNLVEKRRRKVR